MLHSGRLSASSPSTCTQLRALVTSLGRLAHPNVVTVSEMTQDDATLNVRFSVPPLLTLTQWLNDHPSPAHRLRVGASLSATVADLHDATISLGRVHSDGILVRDDCTVVIVDVAKATAFSTDSARLSDQSDLQSLLLEVIGSTDPLRPGSLPHKSDLVAQLSHDNSPRVLAQFLYRASHEIVQANHTSRHAKRFTRPSRRIGVGVAASITAGLIGVVTFLALTTESSEHPNLAVPPPVETASLGVTQAAWNGNRYVIDATTTEPMVGDWTCSGAQHALVYQPASRSLFIFDEWASENNEITGRLIRTFSNEPRFTRLANGTCDQLAAQLGELTEIVKVTRGDDHG